MTFGRVGKFSRVRSTDLKGAQRRIAMSCDAGANLIDAASTSSNVNAPSSSKGVERLMPFDDPRYPAADFRGQSPRTRGTRRTLCQLQLHPAQRRPCWSTGGTTGIGLAISMRFAAEGKQVFALSRRGEDNAGDLDRLVEERGVPRPTILKADVSDRARLAEIAGEIEATGLSLRTVVGSAGINVRKLALEVPDEAIRSIIDINLYGLISTFTVFGPLALKRAGARFIAISSLNAIQGMRLRAPYSGAKAGVDGFCRALAIEWGPLGATVNTIAPGLIETPMTRGYMKEHPERREAGLAHTPVGRLGSPEDIAHAAMFLASEGASFVNGQTLVVDGGLSAGSSWW